MSLSPAYHLRTNKGVERLLFLELLRRLDGKLPKPIEAYRYVGLGGPYLEEFGMIHRAFGNRNMVSLEKHASVQSRQMINRPFARIKPTLDTTEEFVAGYETESVPLIVWFDYEWQDWRQQLTESCALLKKLPPMSIFKITLTGKTEWLGGEGTADPLVAKAEKLSEIFENYGPFGAGDIWEERICRTLYRICRRAIAEAVPDTYAKSVRTLAAYEYSDGTPVLTVTMIVGPLTAIRELLQKRELKDWPFAVRNWRGLKKIDVPPLGLRERLAVDRLLPGADARTVMRRLKLRLGKSYGESVRAMANYIEFYQYVPQLLRVSL